MRTKPLKNCRDYGEIQEATDMLHSKGLSVATIRSFEFCYIPSNTSCRTDLLWERLALPIHDSSGRVTAYAGRQLTTMQSQLEQAFRAKYLDGALADAKISKWENSKWLNEPYEKSKTLFNIHRAYPEIMRKNYAIIVEGYFDVAGLHNKGITNVVATCGTHLSKFQAFFLKALCDNFVLFFDGDKPGQDAAINSRELLHSMKLNSTIVTLENKLDPDDYIIKKNAAKFVQLLDNVVKDQISHINIT